MTVSVDQERIIVRAIKQYNWRDSTSNLPEKDEVLREIVTAAIPGAVFDPVSDRIFQKLSVNGIRFVATTAGYRSKTVRSGEIATIRIEGIYRSPRRVNVKKDGTISLAEIREKYHEILDAQIEAIPDYLADHRRRMNSLHVRNILIEEYGVVGRDDVNIGMKGQHTGLSIEFYNLQEHQVRRLMEAYLNTLGPF